MRPLERSSVEAHGAIWLRAILIPIALVLAADMVWRSRRTIHLRHYHKIFILCGGIGLTPLAGMAANPVPILFYVQGLASPLWQPVLALFNIRPSFHRHQL